MKTTFFLLLPFLLISCGTHMPVSLPVGLPPNPAVRLGDVVPNQERQSWLAQPMGASATYKGHITIADIEKRAGLGSHEMRGGNVSLTLTRSADFGLVSQTAFINNTSVSGLSNTGAWNFQFSLWKDKIKIGESSLDCPLGWIPRGNSAWTNTFVEVENALEGTPEAANQKINFVGTSRLTVSYQPKHSTISTPAGKFLCDRVCIHQTDSLENRGATRPDAVTQVSYTPIKAEFFVSDQVPGLMVRHKFTTWHVNMIYLMLHKNSHLTGKVYPNADVNSRKPQSFGYFELQRLSRP